MALNALEAMTVDVLFFQRPNDPLDHPVLLRAVGRDEHPVAEKAIRRAAGSH